MGREERSLFLSFPLPIVPCALLGFPFLQPLRRLRRRERPVIFPNGDEKRGLTMQALLANSLTL